MTKKQDDNDVKKSVDVRPTLKQIQPRIRKSNMTLLSNIDQLIAEYLKIPKEDMSSRINALKVIHQLIFGLV